MGSPGRPSVGGSCAMLADDLQDLGDVDVDTVLVPPLLLTVVTGEEADLGAVGQEMLDLDHIRLRALGAVHIDSLLLGVGTCYGPPRLTTTVPPPVVDRRNDCGAFRPRSSRRTSKDHEGRSCILPFRIEPTVFASEPGGGRRQPERPTSATGP